MFPAVPATESFIQGGCTEGREGSGQQTGNVSNSCLSDVEMTRVFIFWHDVGRPKPIRTQVKLMSLISSNCMIPNYMALLSWRLHPNSQAIEYTKNTRISISYTPELPISSRIASVQSRFRPRPCFHHRRTAAAASL